MTDNLAPSYLVLLARYFRVYIQARRERRAFAAKQFDPRIVGRQTRNVLPLFMAMEFRMLPLYEQRIAHIARCFGVPVDGNALQQFKDLLMHESMVWSPKKLRAAYLVRRAKTLRDLAVAASTAYPTLCLNPNDYTPLPQYRGHLDSLINP